MATPSGRGYPERVPNALAQETSPYLRQHAENPVDWLPWGPVALARAHAEDKPLLVSIGYSACHWCHVMERESFEDPRTATLMNECFVCVKVDREERPDIDALYMEAVQSDDRSRRLAAERLPHARAAPFLRGDLLPARSSPWHACVDAGAAGDRRVLEREPRGDSRRRRAPARAPVRWRAAVALQRAARTSARSIAAVAKLAESFDARNGGFGGGAEVPAGAGARVPAGARDERTMALSTLHAMASGGIHDQIGGGFARYSVDATWTVPALREDALRQRAARARLPARLAALAGPSPAGGLHRHARVGAARDARPGGRLLQRAGRRLRGRRGALLRVDRRRAHRHPRRGRRRGDRVAGRHRAGQLRRSPPSRAGPERPDRSRGRRPTTRPASASASDCWRRANSASARRSTTSA